MRINQVNEIKEFLSQTIKESLGPDFSHLDAYSLIIKPPKFENGHFCFACFTLSKSLGQKPHDIAKDLAEKISATKSSQITEVTNLGPYLNFKLNLSSFELLKSIKNLDFFRKECFLDSKKTMFEYSQPNTHKELHVGHMRNLCLGNAIVNIFRHAGIETLSATYPGDVGTHVAKVLWYLKKNPELKAPETRKGAWLGTIYAKSHELLESERGGDKEEENRLELTNILKELKKGEGEYFERWKETKEWSIQQMKEIYQWADVEFDHWFFESEVDSASLNLVDEYLEKGLFIEDQGAVGIRFDEEKLGFFLLRKSDGNGLYSTKDLELARRKFQEFNIEENIYIVDSRQSLHFQQVFKTLEKMGFENAKYCSHLSYAFVELPDGAMSSRKGNIIPLQTLLDEMTLTITKRYLEKYRGQWSDEEIAFTAKNIADGAIKYGMCKIDSQKKIVFDMDEWLKLDGNSGPYLQYSYARSLSILKKVEGIDFESADLSLLTHELEQKIIVEMSLFHDVVQESVLKKTPHVLCNYLYNLCQSFNSYYAQVNISKSSDELKKSRAYFVNTFSIYLKESISLLGIKCPKRM